MRPGLPFRTPVVAAQKQMLHILSQLNVGPNWQMLQSKNGAKELGPCALNLFICVHVSFSCD